MTFLELPPSFYWTEESWGAGLRCRALDPIAQHLFTTRQLQLPAETAWEALAQAVGVPVGHVVSLNQAHGRDVVVVGRDLPVERPTADALVSSRVDVALVVKAADCAPMLIADRKTGAVGAVHAGWRGTAARAGLAAIEAMGREFGSVPADLVVAIGPAIGPCCYEVGSDLVDAFAAAGHARYLINRWFLTPRDRKMRFDVAGANRDQLILAGVREEDIHTTGLCTAMHLDLLTSYRAEKDKAGRIAGVIRARSGVSNRG
jgi:YfiH family protein